MKKLFIIILVIFFASHIFPQRQLRVLKIEKPASAKGKRILHLSLKHTQKILATFDLKEGSLVIELADMSGNPYVMLAKAKKEKIKWSHKISQDQNLVVKFSKKNFALIQEKLKGSSIRPGLRLQVRDVSTKLKVKKTNSVFMDQTITKKKLTLGWCEITPVELPDLALQLKYPVRIMPGESFKEDLVVTVENKGAAPATNVKVQIVLSGDQKIPLTPAPVSATFTEDGVLQNGEIVIPSLNPGEKKVLTFENPVTIPLGITPKQYNLGVVVDPGNKINELIENNNIFSGFILVYVPMPKSVTVDLPGTLFIYDPPKFLLNVMNQDVVLSDSREWRKCRFKAYIYHFKHSSWKNYFFEVNTVDREVYLVRGGTFCKRGGQAKRLKMKVIVTGGSRNSVPTKIVLQLTDTQLKFIPNKRELTISMHGYPITHLPYWRVCTESTSLYYFKHLVWPDFYWQVDSFSKTFKRIKKGTFCKDGGEALKLDLTVKTEDQ